MSSLLRKRRPPDLRIWESHHYWHKTWQPGSLAWKHSARLHSKFWQDASSSQAAIMMTGFDVMIQFCMGRRSVRAHWKTINHPHFSQISHLRLPADLRSMFYSTWHVYYCVDWVSVEPLTQHPASLLYLLLALRVLALAGLRLGAQMFCGAVIF